ncbi:hypothetical protein PHJA_001418600 [Phtheirospermum japonicum]|uniref:Uncharacterized protein n=1 Tax=Phtheirospermum japonicum TaxID=374723 RepID=A0A830C8P0_9LAMI|nr:hypothetical protein PHJA_001418600 [Phtheirospermum japonicum]
MEFSILVFTKIHSYLLFCPDISNHLVGIGFLLVCSLRTLSSAFCSEQACYPHRQCLQWDEKARNTRPVDPMIGRVMTPSKQESIESKEDPKVDDVDADDNDDDDKSSTS